MRPPEAQFLRRDGASAYLETRYGMRCGVQTLAKKAVEGGGPLFRKAGRFPIYEIAELDRWANEVMGPSMTSTSTNYSPE